MPMTSKFHEYEQGGQIYEGFLAMPDGAPKGVVLVVHAWGGQSQFDQDKTKMLTELGYAGFAVDLYGKGKRGTNNEENNALMSPLAGNRTELQSRLAFALDVAKSAAGTDNAAALGFCFGGLSVLDMARTNMAVEGVVSFHGILGAPGNTADKIRPKVMVLHGWDDPMAKPEDFLSFTKEMDDAKANWQVHAYGGTMHSFTNPAANNPDFGTVYNAVSARRSFAACQDFLTEVLG